MCTNERQVNERPAEYSQRTAVGMAAGLDNASCKERLREPGLFSPSARIWRRKSSMVFKNIKCTFREETILLYLSMVKLTENTVVGLQQDGFSSDIWKNFPIVKPWCRLSREWANLQHQPSSSAGWMKSCQEWWCLGETRWRERSRARVFSWPDSDSVALIMVQLGDRNVIFWGYERDKPPLFDTYPLTVKEFISWLKQCI